MCNIVFLPLQICPSRLLLQSSSLRKIFHIPQTFLLSEGLRNQH